MDEHGADLFESAAERMRLNASLHLSNEQKLELYGYYKQATEGPCNTSKPGFFDFTGRAKWEAWKSLKDMSPEEAKIKYVSLVNQLDPGWTDKALDLSSVSPIGSSGTGSGPVVSRMADINGDDTISDDMKTLLDWTSEGNLLKVKEFISNGEDVNTKDGDGLTTLHWSCDRGNVEIVQYLVSQGANINSQDNEGQTPLHYAASCGHYEVCKYLLDKGADVNVTDDDGQTPGDVCDSTVKDIFKSAS